MRTEKDPRGPFRFKPVGPFLLRDYSNDDTDDLKGLHGLLEQIQTRHKVLIAGSMNRLIRQWEADLSTAIEDKNKNDEDKSRTEKAAS